MIRFSVPLLLLLACGNTATNAPNNPQNTAPTGQTPGGSSPRGSTGPASPTGPSSQIEAYLPSGGIDGPVKVDFSLRPGAFEASPWPSEVWRKDDGSLDLSKYPAHDNALGGTYTQVVQSDSDGFSVAPAIYLHFDGVPSLSAVPLNPGDTTSMRSPIFMIDVDDNSPNKGEFLPLEFKWYPTGDGKYVSANTLAVKPVAGFVLRSNTTKAQHPIHGVMELGFTEQGELELFRREQGTGPSYARVKPDGTLVFERDLTPALPKPDAWPQFHALSGDRWLLQFLDDERPWIQLDVRTGATTSIPLPKGGMSCHVAPFPDGGYVALVPQIVRSLCLTELYAVRADGTIVWKQRVAGVGPDDSAFERAVSFAQGIARTGEHTFALLGMSELTLVDLERNVLKTWKLEDVLGHRPSYMDGLLSDAKGGVLFEEGDAFHHLDANGAQIATFTPKRADGSRDGVMDHLLRVAPDGRMWTSDRERVYRLDDRGVADLVLGPEAKDDELGEADDTAIDALGRVLAQDRSSRSVHVFDAEGRRIAVCKLAPNERPEGYVSAAFHGARDGSVWVTTSAGLAHFDATGTRIPMPVAAKAEDGKRVNRRDARALLDALEPERAALNAMNQRPDGTWLANVTERAVLPDGRRVLLENAEREDAPASLHLYTPAGEPLHTLALPKDTGMRQLSVGARWIVVGDYGPTWTLVRFEDEKVFRFDSKLEDGGNWIPGQTPDGKTLLLLHAGRMELVRFALP